MNVRNWGQVFTPPHIVEQMLRLRRNSGVVLEPSAGAGAFLSQLDGECVGIEADPLHARSCGAQAIDFFDYPVSNKFATIVGNPPYVRFQDIPQETKGKLNLERFDLRTNMYVFFIDKCLQHLQDKGELIFITPRDFLKATSAISLNRRMFESGTITDFIDLGDARIFNDATPNCAIWRFEKGNYSRLTNSSKQYTLTPGGQVSFVDDAKYTIAFSDIFFVKVGAVSGLDKAFVSDSDGNLQFVNSKTITTGKTRKMIYNMEHPSLLRYKSALMARKIRAFDESNWWQWGRGYYVSDQQRIYVNAKTRHSVPFFTHECRNYDGSVLAVFPRQSGANIVKLREMLNAVDWEELGFVCDGRYLFSQRSLEQSYLPKCFRTVTHQPNPGTKWPVKASRHSDVGAIG